jgi:hypothetical protein
MALFSLVTTAAAAAAAQLLGPGALIICCCCCCLGPVHICCTLTFTHSSIMPKKKYMVWTSYDRKFCLEDHKIGRLIRRVLKAKGHPASGEIHKSWKLCYCRLIAQYHRMPPDYDDNDVLYVYFSL